MVDLMYVFYQKISQLIECKHSISEDNLIDDAKEGARQIVEKNILKNIDLKNMKMQLAMEYLSIRNSVMQLKWNMVLKALFDDKVD